MHFLFTDETEKTMKQNEKHQATIFKEFTQNDVGYDTIHI